jgi:hypothetical protein
MADISAKDVMALRNETGLAMMECKKALIEMNGDVEAAEDHLRKKLKGKMETRTDRAAGEGRVDVLVVNDGGAPSIVETPRRDRLHRQERPGFIAATAPDRLQWRSARAPVTSTPTDDMNATSWRT